MANLKFINEDFGFNCWHTLHEETDKKFLLLSIDKEQFVIPESTLTDLKAHCMQFLLERNSNG